jgi:hypothetical protein
MDIRHHAFREMRLHLTLVRGFVQLLLGIDFLQWKQTDYALFLVMSEMWDKTINPTYPQMIGILVAWMRFYQRLIDRLPDGELKDVSQAEWHKACDQYAPELAMGKEVVK